MDDRFSKLRFNAFAKAAAAGVIAGAIALQPTPGVAATGSVQITVGNGKWFVNTNITFSTTSSGSLALSSASLHTASAATALSYNRNDAFDGALSWHVYASPPGVADSSGGYVQAGGVVSVTSNSVVGPNKTLAGLNVHTELYFPSSKSVVRSILYMQNPTGAPITVTVDNDNDLGSDIDTTIQATSSGDATFDATDNWVISCQLSGSSCPGPGNLVGTSDPILTYAFQGPGGIRATSAGSSFANGNGNPNFRFSNVTVPAGETRAVMMFVQMSDTVADAEADAPRFNTLQGTDYLALLSPAQTAEIVNWNVSALGVPSLSQWALAAMAGLLGLAGAISAGLFGRFRLRRAGSS
jgi:hypothetical protein